jgi:ABC-2 type transport system ATP-binding protein
MTAVVEAESLSKRFGEVPAVTDLSFALEAGTITGFLGPNGAGKTTTLRMILGLVAPSRGRALVFGHPYAELPRAALRVGAVLEATDFHPGRSGRDHLRMLGPAYWGFSVSPCPFGRTSTDSPGARRGVTARCW